MSNYNAQSTPPELKPSNLEKLALLSMMYVFSFTLAICIITLPLAHMIMPGGGVLGFLLRCGVLYATVICTMSYLSNVAKVYNGRVLRYMNSLTEDLSAKFEMQKDEKDDEN